MHDTCVCRGCMCVQGVRLCAGGACVCRGCMHDTCACMMHVCAGGA